MAIDPQTKYLYKNGSHFECSRGKLAIDEIKFANGDFIIYPNHKFDRNTTIVDLQALFPNAAKQIESVDVVNGEAYKSYS